MPVVIELIDVTTTGEPFKPIFFLLKEDKFPIEGLKDLKGGMEIALEDPDAAFEDVLNLAESIIKEHYGTMMPFSLYRITYSKKE